MSIREEAEAAVRFYGSVAAAMASGKATNLVQSQLNEMLIFSGDTYKLSKGDRIREVDNQRNRFIKVGFGAGVINLKTGDTMLVKHLPFPLEIYRYARS